MHTKLESKKRCSIELTLILLVVSLNVFFEYVVYMKIAYPIIIFLQCFYIIKAGYLTINKNRIFLFVLILAYALIQLILAPLSVAPDISTYDASLRFVTMIIGALFYLYGDWYKYGARIFFIFSSIHVVFTLVSYLFPEFFSFFILENMNHEFQKKVLLWKAEGVYSGITEQVGRNALYITVGISIVYCKLTSSDKKHNRKHIIILGIYLLALLLTGKRGHLIANLIIMIIIYTYKAKLNDKKMFRKLVKILFVIILVIVGIIFVFPEASAPIQRFYQRGATGDITTGRIELYRYAIKMFKEKPFLGWGTGVFKAIHYKQTHTHNIYLQLLSENGVIGLGLFISILILNFTQTIRALRKTHKNNNKDLMLYLTFSLYIQLFFIIYGMTGNPLSDNYILILYLVSSSIPFSLKTTSVNNKRKLYH